jgi:hypothetical protein
MGISLDGPDTGGDKADGRRRTERRRRNSSFISNLGRGPRDGTPEARAMLFFLLHLFLVVSKAGEDPWGRNFRSRSWPRVQIAFFFSFVLLLTRVRSIAAFYIPYHVVCAPRAGKGS